MHEVNDGAIQARRPHGAEPGMSLAHPHVDEYPNPFQQRPTERNHQQQHYNIMIPTVDAWPEMIRHGFQVGKKFSLNALGILYEKYEAYQANRSAGYQGLPTAMSDLSPQTPRSHPRNIHLGGKRYLKQGAYNCSGRRLGRILTVLIVATIFVVFVLLPRHLQPFANRIVWVRYYNHEEPVKVELPYGRVVHVADVKKLALKEIQSGFESRSLGQVKLIYDTRYAWDYSDQRGALQPGAVWKNGEAPFRTEHDHPIIATELDYGLLSFLNQTLGCFSGFDVYGETAIKFRPPGGYYEPLAEILSSIGDREELWQDLTVRPSLISYLREGFNDPKKNEYYNADQLRDRQARTGFVLPDNVHAFRGRPW